MSYSIKRVAISILITLVIIALCLSTMFFAKKAYAEIGSVTYSMAGGSNLDGCYYDPISPSFWFFIDEVPVGVTVASLSVTAWDIDSPSETPTVSLYEPDGTYHGLGILTGSDDTTSTTTFTFDPSWIKPGKTIVYVRTDTGGGWCVDVGGGTLTLWTYQTPRTDDMMCKMVWINDNNHFQFSFINLYADNNWVRIYDMEGNMVYEVDMPLKDGNLKVDLPDGMYMVKTFHDQPEPIQEFMIGKPAAEPAPDAEM